MVHWDNVTPGSREEFLRALVYILETKKLTHLSFAIAKAASEETPSDLNERELTALIDLAKRMLLEIGELALAE